VPRSVSAAATLSESVRLVVPIVGLAGGGVCVSIACTSRIPGWVWRAQREEFERWFARPSQFFALSLFLAAVLVTGSLLFLGTLLSGK